MRQGFALPQQKPEAFYETQPKGTLIQCFPIRTRLYNLEEPEIVL